ncbi:ABC transporter permease [Paenalkalicoccus suaedae]|uniref:Cell division protein FtsX n=1 Tax=Paenalkalicoccus suaedae TaxID=2592382 RepID=A0A859FGM6_9BACI|nr:permease-like cell division protein FtsX [Paenalkalicoccus suaedae]QKS72279.1 ABC transporter permease [Paenalkalicoccus suaedae]
MKARTLNRHIKEGSKNLFRNGWMTFASLSAVTIMLLVVGTFLLIIMNINSFASSLEDDVQIRVFIDRAAEQEQIDTLEAEIAALPRTESVLFIPKEEGLESIIESLGDQGGSFVNLRDENPLNDEFVVHAIDPAQTEFLATEIESLASIEDVSIANDLLDRLFAATDLVRIIGAVLIVGLLFTAIFLIANTIKLTIVARKTEIQIMKLVGATNGFIRWPFFVEGLMLGVIGSLIPIALLSYGYRQFYETVGQSANLDFFEFLPAYPLVFQTGILLIGIGAIVGVWGSIMSVRKFLQV